MASIKCTVLAALAAVALPLSQAANSWSIISPKVGSPITGVAFFDANNGIAVGSDGLGYQIWVSSDGGKTFPVTAPNQGGYIFPLFDGAASGTAAVVTGQFGEQFSLNKAAFFNSSLGGGNAGDVRAYSSSGTTLFGVVGNFNNGAVNGIGTSVDGGLTITPVNISSLTCDSSYAAFPSLTTWYVTGGDVPQSDDQPSDSTTSTSSGSTSSGSTSTAEDGEAFQPFSRRLSNRLSIDYAPNKGAKLVVTPHRHTLRGRALQTSGFAAQIVKTTDGGNSWTSQYTSSGLVGANGIDCASTTNCCAALEADSGSAAGAYIMCTQDGNTWTTTHNDTSSGATIVDIRAVNGNYIAVGGTATQTSFTAIFWTSTDGGKTWTAETTIPNYLAIAIECLNGQFPCWASLADTDGDSFIATRLS